MLLVFVGCGGESAQEERRAEKAAVKEAIRGYYAAIEAQDYEKAYSYVGPAERSWGPKSQWIAVMSNDPPTNITIHTVIVRNLAGDKAIATVEASYNDSTGERVQEVLSWEVVKENGEWKLNDTVKP